MPTRVLPPKGLESGNGPGGLRVGYASDSSTSRLSSASVNQSASLARLSDEEAEEPFLSNEDGRLAAPDVMPVEPWKSTEVAAFWLRKAGTALGVRAGLEASSRLRGPYQARNSSTSGSWPSAAETRNRVANRW